MTLRAHKNPDRATTGNPEKSILIIFNFMLDMSYFPVLVATELSTLENAHPTSS